MMNNRNICLKTMYSVFLWTCFALTGVDSAFSQQNHKMSDSDKIDFLQRKIDIMQNALDKLKTETSQDSNTEVVGGASSVGYAPKTCPAGQYAVGIEAWGAPANIRYCIGCLTGVRLICRKFPS